MGWASWFSKRLFYLPTLQLYYFGSYENCESTLDLKIFQNAVNCFCQNKIQWQPPMEGEDVDETASGNEQQQQQQGGSAPVDTKPMDAHQSPAAEARMTSDKVR